MIGKLGSLMVLCLGAAWPGAALAHFAPLVAPPARLLPPVSPACVSSPFGPRVLPALPFAGTFHRGIDIPAPLGAPVRAVAAGTVIRIERRGPGGLQMLVQHAGFVGVYSHFGSIAPPFADGTRAVAAGEKLGVVGLTGVTTGPHVYFGMIVAGRPVDPAPLLGVLACERGRDLISGPGPVLSPEGKILPTRVLVRTRRGTVLEPALVYAAHRAGRIGSRQIARK